MSFAIVTDSSANLGAQLAEQNGISVIPLPYFMDGKQCECVDPDSFDDKGYYNMLRRGVSVTTSQISPHSYIEHMEPLLQAGQDILFIGISSGISGAFASAQMAREELLEQYPEREICLVDSLGASLGEGMLALRAAMCRENGMDLQETAKRLTKLRQRIYQVFIVDDLVHLKRTGRVSSLGAMVGSVLGIKPLLKGSPEGKIVSIGKVRGRKAAIKELADKCVSMIKNTQLIGMSHADCAEDAEYLMQIIKSKLSRVQFLLTKHEPATGSHLGPGALAIYFEGADDVREK